jgi:hypothetical protein
MIARQKDTGFGWKIRGFWISRHIYYNSAFSLFWKKIWKIQKKYKTYYKKYKMVKLSFKNDICIGIKYVFVFFRFFRFFSKKKQMLNYSKRLSMWREIQNPLIVQPNPESFCRAIIFSSGLRGRRRTYHTILKLADHALFKMIRYVLMRRLRPELDGRPSSANYSDSSTKL